MKTTIFALLIGSSLTCMAKKPAQFIQNLQAGQEQTVVTFGTSLTKVGAWVDQLRVSLEQAYPGKATVINGAQGGANSDWGRTAFQEKVLAHQPDTVFIEFAVNDAVAKRRTSIAHCRQNLEHFIDTLLAKNAQCEVILQVMNVCIGNTRTERPNLEAYNQMYREVAKERGLRLIDHWPNWQKLLDEDPERFLIYMPDAIHPIREGALKVITPHLFSEIGFTAEVSPEESKATPMWDYFFHLTRDKEKQATTQATYHTFWEQYFERTDLNQDQSISGNEFCAPNLFKLTDANGNGKVDLSELQESYKGLFEFLDQNSDGQVTKEEQATLGQREFFAQ